MGLARYFVVGSSENWLVTLDGRAMARCVSRTEAIEAAMVMADLMGAMHHDADVMAETADGAPLELIWTYGVDTKPPQRRRRARRPEDAPPHHLKRVQRGGEQTQ